MTVSGLAWETREAHNEKEVSAQSRSTAPPPPKALPGMLEAAAPESKGGRSLDLKM